MFYAEPIQQTGESLYTFTSKPEGFSLPETDSMVSSLLQM